MKTYISTIFLSFSVLLISSSQYITNAFKVKWNGFQTRSINKHYIQSRRHASNSLNMMEYDYQGLINDMGTVFIGNAVSDVIAQYTENRKSVRKVSTVTQVSIKSSSPISLTSPQKIDLERTKRFAIFGFFDGAFGHTWFLLLDQFITGTDSIHIVQKIVADAVVFTPSWCVWFLIVMGILEGSLITKIKENKFGNEYKELLALDLGFFIPVSCLVYSVVPRESRVLAFSIANLVYTSIVSVWNQNNIDKSAEES